jgi:hypothetical protein
MWRGRSGAAAAPDDILYASALSSDDHDCLDMLLYLAPSMEHDRSIGRRIARIGYL